MKSIPYVNEITIRCEVTIRLKKHILGTVYRSPNQNSDDFEFSGCFQYQPLPDNITLRL